MRIQDVARLLDAASRGSKINPGVIAKILSRLIGTLEFSIMAAVGRPEADRTSKMIRGSLERLSQRIELRESVQKVLELLDD
jgi:hypothetical protein